MRTCACAAALALLPGFSTFTADQPPASRPDKAPLARYNGGPLIAFPSSARRTSRQTRPPRAGRTAATTMGGIVK